MNLEKFSFKLNYLLFGLLFTSAFPAITLSSVLFDGFNNVSRYKIYIVSLFIREFFHISIRYKDSSFFKDKIASRRINFNSVFIFLPIILIIIFIFLDNNFLFF